MAQSNVVVAFFKGAKMKTKLALQYAVGAGAQKARARCEDMISARDHTLKELADEGHPYAKRDPHNPHDPPEVVHVQEGELISGLDTLPPKGNSEGVSASVINRSPEDVWIQEGTPTMIARPYMKAVRRIYGQEILDAMKTEFHKHVDFKGDSNAA